MKKSIFISSVVILIIGALGYFVVHSQMQQNRFAFSLGLDLSGGTALVYEAQTDSIDESDRKESMDALRDVIERRINLYGVAEPVVQVQQSTLSGEVRHRLSVEIPGVTDVDEAVALIGQTPFLEFKIQSDGPQQLVVGEDGTATIDMNNSFVSTPLTGKYIRRAQLVFDQATGDPRIALDFNQEGAALFEQITRENIGKVLAIYLDGQPISAPVIREAITGGQAEISGGFTPQEARILVGRLNAGALPVSIELLSSQSIGPTLGADTVNSGVQAALWGIVAIVAFLIIVYGAIGIVGIVSLISYIIVILTLYQVLPVTLTASGIAGFIISIGLAIDAYILVMERYREEKKSGKKPLEALTAGYGRAWESIRDANIAALLTSLILFWFGSTLIKGFALTLGLGVIVSLLCVSVVSRVLLRLILQIQSRN